MRTATTLKNAALAGAAVLLAGHLLLVPAAAAQDAHGAPAEHGAPAAAHGEQGGADHGNPVLQMAAKLFNFAILAGTLVYFMRSPLRQYLGDRGTQIRADLVKAAEMKTAAGAQLAAVEDKLAALPGELDALRRTGAEEVAAEEARIRALADAERQRLLAQMQREIDLHARTAERDLLRVAADRAIAAATRTITSTMTEADHARLQERYVTMVGK